MPKLFWLLAVGLVTCRFYDFRPYLDHPHLFRQAETAFYSLGFYRFGMNILAPSVGWMGAYRHVILEFPLTEWIAASIYHLMGPTILIDRLVNLVFFIGSAFFLFRIVGVVHDRLLASIVTLLYLSAPLGMYYSRAVHVDFTAVCFSHAMLFHAMRFVTTMRRRDLVAAMLAGTLAFAVKAPYAFYLLLPALFFCRQRGESPRVCLLVIASFAVPAAAFVGWFAYAQAVNRRAPDLSFIPSYFSHLNRFGWYFGTLADRWTLEPWQTVVGRIFREIASTVWWVLVPFGLLARRQLATYFRFTLCWSVGTLVYLLLFLTLNADHNYYQIPFIAVFSMWLGAPIYAAWTATGSQVRWGRAVAGSALLAYAASSVFVATQRFYRTDPVHLAVGEFVSSRTSENDLVVMAYTDAEYADPSFLFYARRYGWSVSPEELSPRILDALAPHGASVVVTSTVWPTGKAARFYLEAKPSIGVLQIAGGQVTVRRLAPTGASWP